MSGNDRPRLPSVLAGWQKVLLGAALAVAAFLLANTAYLLLNRLADAAGWGLFRAGETALPDLFQVMVLTHTGAGLLLAALAAAFVVAHLPTVWRRRHRESVVSGIVLVGTGLVLVITGLFVVTRASSQENRWAWWVHVLCGALVPLGYAVHRLVSYTRPPGVRFRRFGAAVAALTGLLVAGHLATQGTAGRGGTGVAAAEEGRGPGARGRDVAKFLDGAWVPAGFVPPESPFFPSAATTTSGDVLPPGFLTRPETGVSDERIAEEVAERGFVAEAPIGAETCSRCHPDVVAQWKQSAHRFASFNNPFYEATVDHMRRTADEPNRWVERHRAAFPDRVEGVARAKSKWCGGCHDPALMLTGRMGGRVDATSRAAQAGLTCLACHAIDTIHGVTGNGNYNIADGRRDPYLFPDAPAGTPGAFLHDAALKAKPAVHKRRMMKPVFRRAKFCATCHKVSLREPVNNYRWLRGQDEYDAWHDSGISRNAARTFYLPARSRRCQDCHMPRVPAPRGDLAAEGGTVRSHRFPAANTALPHVRGDSGMIRRIESFLQKGKMRVDVFALRRGGGPAAVEMPLDERRPALAVGERVTVDVVVRNQGVGHTFPGGTNDSNQGWLEMSLVDGDGTVLARSGAIGDDGHLDPMAHAYKAVMLDGDGDRIRRRNAQDIHVTAAANLVGPGTSDVVHYEFTVPPGVSGPLRLRARLMWRKFDRPYTEFAYHANPRGFKTFDTVPDLPVTEIASDEVALPVRELRAAGGAGRGARDGAEARNGAPAGGSAGAAGPGAAGSPGEGTPAWVRYNDYGIGLLLQGHLRLARRAFRRVAEVAPDRIDGPLNLARTALRDGDVERAYEHLERVEEVDPGDPRAAWVWGRTLQEDGRYEDAASAYRRVLRAFPDDRAAWRNLGRVLYLDQRFEAALRALERVLAIDPEDRVAHYYRMLIHRAAGRQEKAEAARKAFERYRIDESARALTRSYLQRHPGVNLMAQPIHVHELETGAARQTGPASGRPGGPPAHAGGGEDRDGGAPGAG